MQPRFRVVTLKINNGLDTESFFVRDLESLELMVGSSDFVLSLQAKTSSFFISIQLPYFF